MPDRDKVIYDIERCICHVPDACRDCSHFESGNVLDCMERLLKDALELLKEHDSVDAIFAEMTLINGDSMFVNTKYITAYRYIKDLDETAVALLSEKVPVNFPGDQTVKITNAFNYINKDRR